MSTPLDTLPHPGGSAPPDRTLPCGCRLGVRLIDGEPTVILDSHDELCEIVRLMLEAADEGGRSVAIKEKP